MRAGIGRKSQIFIGAVFSCAIGFVQPVIADGDDAARAIAERFAQPAKSSKSKAAKSRAAESTAISDAEDQRLLEEVDMLERARAEAEARRAAQMEAGADRGGAFKAETERDHHEAQAEARRLAEEQRKADDARRLAEEQRKADDARRLAEEQRKADDARRLAEEQRKADDARRLAEEQRKADDARRLAEEQRKADDARRLAEEQRKADDARRLAEQKRAAEAARLSALEAQREADADRLTRELETARLARQALGEGGTGGGGDDAGRRVSLDGGRFAPLRDGAPTREAHSRDSPSDRPEHDFDARPSTTATRVTVLLHMEPGNYGIRRNNKSADPLLCQEWECFVSRGAGDPAQSMRRRRAFGIGRTLGARAGACANALGCVFRGVELGSYPAVLQPVDMHVFRHDKREPMVVRETSACRLWRGELQCEHAFEGPGYVMWVVPEEMAEKAGSQALQAAVDLGLRAPQSVRAMPAAYRRER